MTTDKEKDTLYNLIAIAVGAVIGVPLRAWVIATLWAWLVVPTIANAPELSFLGALSLFLVSRLFAVPRPRGKSERDALEDMKNAFGFGIVAPLVALLIGAILRGFL